MIRALRAVVRYVGDVMGDTHYARYVEHRRRDHPGESVLSEREYWRARHEGAVTARCC
ncbi:YbdD/YjiX family protein [Tsukamurella sp. 8F]|uniref:YbdD/YjiX family protein n=1 Tax=unclassified Tsukamurella TaxID=2633480 RepID=UPI0023B8BA45|nr:MULTISPECIES: YbdD/YjiX family protein [unclassified Tsukamurella]MDF0530130.1 YbdD/YjiX family protein [Tsukamurella sp. 8J]MDF0586448.1 YbdD/YjiX family protein [Tsukamurella sp. 8F]